LILGRSGNIFVDGQVREKGSDLGCAHVLGVKGAFWCFVKEDEAFDSINVGFFSSDRIMLEADRIAHLVKEPG